jgi:hypothetical protein
MGVVSEISQADVPIGATVLTSKFDFRIKYTPDGNPAEYQSRLCVRSDQQEEVIDFKEVYAPTAAANTTRLLLAEAAYRQMHVHQVDVKAAFLNAPIEEELCMRLPHGIAKLKGKVWRLQKAMYGLRQAVNAWHGKLSAELGKYGFTYCMTDPCLFVKRKGVNATCTLVYVDDMLIWGESSDVVLVKKQISHTFTFKDSGVAYHFLGFLIHRDECGIRLPQVQYTKTVLDRFGYVHSHGKRTPFNKGTVKQCAVRCQCENAERSRTSFKDTSTECICEPYGLSSVDFAAFVGSAMFLARRTRRDIAYPLGVLSRFLSNPKKFHEALVKHMLRYSRGTIDWGLWNPSGKYLRECPETIPEHMLLYPDADH